MCIWIGSLCALNLLLAFSLFLYLSLGSDDGHCACISLWTVQQQQQKPNKTDVVKFIALSRCHPSKILHLSPANKHTKRWIEHIWALTIFHCWTTTPTTASTATMATTRWEFAYVRWSDWVSERAWAPNIQRTHRNQRIVGCSYTMYVLKWSLEIFRRDSYTTTTTTTMRTTWAKILCANDVCTFIFSCLSLWLGDVSRIQPTYAYT